MSGVALTIAGSDPSGGAGIQADLKTFHQLGVYGEAAITLITVQNTQEVGRVEPLPADLVIEQIRSVVADIPPNAAKTGALGSLEIIEELADLAASFVFPLIVDPVMISKHGMPLLRLDAQQALMTRLLPRAFLVTPNIPEAETLAGMKIETETEMQKAADKLIELGCRAVLIKGGHKSGDPVDIFVAPEGRQRFAGRRIETRHTHGTGCTYSAAITANLARSMDLLTAISNAKAFIEEAISTAPGLGHGYGPVNHFAKLLSEA